MEGNIKTDFCIYTYIQEARESCSYARKAVGSIIDDLISRRGLKQEFHTIDAEIQREIIQKWEGIISDILDKRTEY